MIYMLYQSQLKEKIWLIRLGRGLSNAPTASLLIYPLRMSGVLHETTSDDKAHILENVEYPVIDISPRSILTWSGNTS